VFAQAFEPQDGGAGPRPVRSVLDMRELDAAMPFPIQPFVVLLHPEAEAGGFVREWPQLDRHPDLMPERNLSYAVQWFAMAAAVLVIFVITALRRPPEETLPDVKDGKE
jgi:surfeit locus 1 family protein